MALQWKKVSAGYYRLTVGPGETDRFDAYFITSAEMRGSVYGAHWNLTYPGQWEASESAETLRQCKEWAADWLANTDPDIWRSEMDAEMDAEMDRFRVCFGLGE
jgi:hypothetical protein